ncbi:MAG: hypothetical protein C4560_09815 [Nitrospiraceae bacterium]|nr:MAG: hypothetical protein C4560_09815 [Nitrospiraceae bacterium]
MKKFAIVVSLFLFSVFCVSATVVAQGNIMTDQNGRQYVDGEVIVKPVSSVDIDKVVKSRTRMGSHVIRKSHNSGIVHVKLSTDLSVKEAVDNYTKSGLVEFAEPNYVYHTDVIPDDTRFGELWGLNNTGAGSCKNDADIDAPEAWDFVTGSSNFIIMVIDTGMDYTHPDLQANRWVNTIEKNGVAGIDDDGNGYVDDIYGIDTVNHDSNPMDDNGHGTHVSGTIGAIGNNGNGVVGVMWDATIMPCKFLNSGGSGSTSGAIECLDYAVDMKMNHGHDIRLTSNSWGGGGFSNALQSAINASKQQGMLFIAAAGNDHMDTDITPHYPSSYTVANIISVASTDCNDNLSSFSNWGLTSVDVAAPGSAILSTVPGGGYATYSGTSMATPHVSGLAGLIWAKHPDWPWKRVRNKILNKVDSLSSLSGKIATGGRINAKKAVKK